MWLNWKVVSAMPPPRRNEVVAQAVRTYLNARPANAAPLSSGLIAGALWPGWKLPMRAQDYREQSGKLASLLTRLAPHMQGFALQDGEQVTRGDRTRRRWNWYGQDRGVL